MRQAWIFTCVFALALGAPMNLVGQKNDPDGCRMEFITVWEEVETEEVNKVVCETEFREECFTEHEKGCSNSTEPMCTMEDELVCTDTITNKCGMEQVLRNETYSQNECNEVYKIICEYKWVGEGKTKVWVPVEDSCVAKPFEECDDIMRYRENLVDEEVCRDTPIKDCKNIPKEICFVPAENQVCEDVAMEKCELVPHEECKQITGKVPTKVNKKVTKLMCADAEGEQEKNVCIDLETSIDIADFSKTEISDSPEIIIENSEDPEMVNLDIEEEELSVSFSEPEFSEITTENVIKTMLSKTDTAEGVTMKKTPTVSVLTEDTVYVIDMDSEADKRKFDDSKIIFPEEEINNRNKVLATRVFIDDGLLSPNPAGNISPATEQKHFESDRIFFPDQEFNG